VNAHKHTWFYYFSFQINFLSNPIKKNYFYNFCFRYTSFVQIYPFLVYFILVYYLLKCCNYFFNSLSLICNYYFNIHHSLPILASIYIFYFLTFCKYVLNLINYQYYMIKFYFIMKKIWIQIEKSCFFFKTHNHIRSLRIQSSFRQTFPPLKLQYSS